MSEKMKLNMQAFLSYIYFLGVICASYVVSPYMEKEVVTYFSFLFVLSVALPIFFGNTDLWLEIRNSSRKFVVYILVLLGTMGMVTGLKFHTLSELEMALISTAVLIGVPMMIIGYVQMRMYNMRGKV